MHIYKTGREYKERVIEIIRVEGGYNFRMLWSGISAISWLTTIAHPAVFWVLQFWGIMIVASMK